MKKNRDFLLFILIAISTSSVFFSWVLYKKVYVISKESAAPLQKSGCNPLLRRHWRYKVS
jgi:hypothetical protein